MKVTLDLDQDLLSRIYTVRTHDHKNSRRAALPEMELPEFLTAMIEVTVLCYEEEFFGFVPEVRGYDPS